MAIQVQPAGAVPRSKQKARALAALVAVASLTGCVTTSGSSDGSPRPQAPAPSTPTSTATTGTTTSGIAAGPTTSVGPRTSTTSPGGESTTTATMIPAPASAVDRLAVRADPSGGVPDYRRAAFGDGWDYDPASGCNTRERVLIEDSLVPPTVDDRCRSTGGRWRSIYDGVVTNDPADLEVDHVIPLADAWRSGAAAWTDEQRRTFANDLVNPEALAAVSVRSNRSKGDSRPDEWLPEDRNEWCRYATGWVELKVRWGLSVTASEKAALVRVLEGC